MYETSGIPNIAFPLPLLSLPLPFAPSPVLLPPSSCPVNCGETSQSKVRCLCERIPDLLAFKCFDIYQINVKIFFFVHSNFLRFSRFSYETYLSRHGRSLLLVIISLEDAIINKHSTTINYARGNTFLYYMLKNSCNFLTFAYIYLFSVKRRTHFRNFSSK